MARTRGFDFSANGSTVTVQSIISGLITPVTGGSSSSSSGSSLTVSPSANLQLGIIPAGFFGALQALRQEGVAKFLAEPKVVTQTGRAAFFRAGGQQATLSASSGITGPGVQYVPFGTELEVLPIVYGNGMIWLEINPRITAISAALGITVGGAISPGFTEQQVRSAVMLESGQTFAIGGLIQNTVQSSTSRVPILGDLPFIGMGFSTITHSQIENELLIMVTPRLVGPMNCDQVPKRVAGRESRNPDDYELFLENILEAPRGQRKVWNGRCYNAAYKCDPTAATFPCVGGVCTGRVGPVAPVVPMPGSASPYAPTPSSSPSSLPPIPPQPMPGGGATALPVVPGSPVGEIGSTSEPPTAIAPASLPAVIVIPEVPRN
jgi:pilus assembly protein CpaC